MSPFVAKLYTDFLPANVQQVVGNWYHYKDYLKRILLKSLALNILL